jgi:SOS-response transcriptional repressor LexA
MRTQTVPLLAIVHAGTPTPLDFWKIENFRTIRAIYGSKTTDRFAALTVSGDSLREQGIYDGDILIFKFTNFAPLTKLCVWQTPYGITAKYAQKTDADTITLHNQNGWQRDFNISDCRMVGVVVRVERDV